MGRGATGKKALDLSAMKKSLEITRKSGDCGGGRFPDRGGKGGRGAKG